LKKDLVSVQKFRSDMTSRLEHII